MGALALSRQGRIMGQGSEWDRVFAALGRAGLDDVYFDHRYVSLYCRAGESPEAFAYERGEHLFFFCYLRRPLDRWGLSGRHDFETAYGYGGPLSTTSDPEFLAEAWAAFGEHARRSGLVAGFVRFHPLFENQRWAAGPELVVEYNCPVVYLSLDKSPERVWRDYPGDNRNKINKAKRLGVVVSAEQGAGALAAFAGLYHRRMAELGAHEDYLFGDAYFQAVAGLGAQRYRVHLARAEGELIGGALVLLSPRFVHYHLSACPMEYRRFAPNNILRHEVIGTYLGGEWEMIHFGGGRTESRDDPLLKFKQRFSPEEGSFYVGKYLADEQAYQGLCRQWREARPELAERYARRFLCYRYQ